MNLNLVLKRLDDYRLRLQLNKCKFMQKSVTYMGCIISAEGISLTEDKIEAIKQAPRSENTTQLRAFLGMVNYHGKFIHNLSSILQPLNQLLQRNQEFTWSRQCEEAFNKAKYSLTTSALTLTSSHTSIADTSSQSSKAALCGVCEPSYHQPYDNPSWMNCTEHIPESHA